MKLKTGDKVVVVSGSNKGKEGKITKILDNKVIVEGVNIVKKHLKPKNNSYYEQKQRIYIPIEGSSSSDTRCRGTFERRVCCAGIRRWWRFW